MLKIHSPHVCPSSCISGCRSCSTPIFFSVRFKNTHTHTYMHVLRVMSMSFVKSRISLPHGQRPHLTVEHLIPHNNIQLHAVKIVPEKQRQIFFYTETYFGHYRNAILILILYESSLGWTPGTNIHNAKPEYVFFSRSDPLI